MSITVIYWLTFKLFRALINYSARFYLPFDIKVFS